MLDKVIAIVPSRSRVEVLKKNTYRWLPQLGTDFRIFVEPQQAKAYEHFDNLEVIEKNDQGVGYAFQQAANFARSRKFKYVFKLDDDIGSFVERGGHVLKDHEAETQRRAETARRALEESLVLLERYPDIGAVGFPYRNELFTDSKVPLINKRLQTSFVIKTALYHPKPEYKVREDFIAYVNLRQAGYSTLRLPQYGISCGVAVGGGSGGINDFDRKTLAQKEMEMIRRHFPNVVFKYAPNDAADWQVDFQKTKF